MHALHPRRQPARRQQRAGLEVRLQGDHVVQRELAGEQVAQQVHALLLERPAEKGVHGEQAGQVDVVLGEGRAAGDRHAPEHPLCRVEAVGRGLPAMAEVLVDLDEVGAVERHVDGQDAQADAFEARDVDRTGNQLGEHRQPFLGGGDARRGARQ